MAIVCGRVVLHELFKEFAGFAVPDGQRKWLPTHFSLPTGLIIWSPKLQGQVPVPYSTKIGPMVISLAGRWHSMTCARSSTSMARRRHGSDRHTDY